MNDVINESIEKIRAYGQANRQKAGAPGVSSDHRRYFMGKRDAYTRAANTIAFLADRARRLAGRTVTPVQAKFPVLEFVNKFEDFAKAVGTVSEYNRGYATAWEFAANHLRIWSNENPDSTPDIVTGLRQQISNQAETITKFRTELDMANGTIARMQLSPVQDTPRILDENKRLAEQVLALQKQVVYQQDIARGLRDNISRMEARDKECRTLELKAALQAGMNEAYRKENADFKIANDNLNREIELARKVNDDWRTQVDALTYSMTTILDSIKKVRQSSEAAAKSPLPGGIALATNFQYAVNTFDSVLAMFRVAGLTDENNKPRKVLDALPNPAVESLRLAEREIAVLKGQLSQAVLSTTASEVQRLQCALDTEKAATGGLRHDNEQLRKERDSVRQEKASMVINYSQKEKRGQEIIDWQAKELDEERRVRREAVELMQQTQKENARLAQEHTQAHATNNELVNSLQRARDEVKRRFDYGKAIDEVYDGLRKQLTSVTMPLAMHYGQLMPADREFRSTYGSAIQHAIDVVRVKTGRTLPWLRKAVEPTPEYKFADGAINSGAQKSPDWQNNVTVAAQKSEGGC